jgi:hypothetical protein
LQICNLEDLNALPEEFAAYPRQAIACSINNVEPANGKSWPTNRSELQPIEDIFKSCKTFTINVKSVQDDGILDVGMTTADGEDVAELLRRRGFAAPLQVETKSIRSINNGI